jgi:hypothetical protein
MPLSPPLMLEAGSGTKFQLLPLFNIVGPFLGLARNLGHVRLGPNYSLVQPLISILNDCTKEVKVAKDRVNI